MKKISEILKDFIKIIIVGSVISIAIFIIVGIISLLISKFNPNQSIQNVRSALLIIGSLGIMLGALLILKKRTEKELLFKEDWKKKYNVLSYKIVLILISFIILLYGGIIDWLIIKLIYLI